MADDVLENKKISSFKALRHLISYDWIVGNINYFLFLAALTIIYIANGHQADKMIRDSDAITDEIKELQFEYKTVKSEFMFRSREAEIIKSVAPTGLKVSSKPPYRIKLIERNKE